MIENKIEEITVNNVTKKEIALRTLMQLVDKFDRGHWGDIQLFEDEESRYSTAIEKVIEEIQQYRAIGTVEELEDELYALRVALDFYQNVGSVDECRKAVEKQTPMKPKLSRIDNETIYCKCPMCNLTTVLYNNCVMNYCKECGQKLDWEE